MSVHLIRRAQRILQRSSGGTESVAGSVGADPARASLLFEQARSRSGLDAPKAGIEAAHAQLALAYLEEGRKALAEVATRGDAASLTQPQLIGLEAIVRLTGRPSFLVQNDTVSSVPADSEWAGPLTAASIRIRDVLQRVGRVNLPQYGGPGYVGTAFLVSSDIVMTNRHVAMTFAQAKAGGAWSIGPGLTPSVDFKCEYQGTASLIFKVTGIVLIHPDPLIDLALLRIAKHSEKESRPLPDPLFLGNDAADISPQRLVYVVGYPAYDPRNDGSAMNQIFGDVFFVKRFAPGDVMDKDDTRRQFTHDCSTLGGNSGSCVVDFIKHRVFGLHFGGSYLVENRAVSVPMLHADTDIAGKGLNFG